MDKFLNSGSDYSCGNLDLLRHRKTRNYDDNSVDMMSSNLNLSSDENSKENHDDRTSKQGPKPDTFIIPLIQIFPLDIRDDEIITSNIFNFAPVESKIFLATAYFNVTKKYWDHILKSSCTDFDIVMAHPEANGFFNAPGLAGLQVFLEISSLIDYRSVINVRL